MERWRVRPKRSNGRGRKKRRLLPPTPPTPLPPLVTHDAGEEKTRKRENAVDERNHATTAVRRQPSRVGGSISHLRCRI
ncbi:hypothetical protein U1Q18_038079 [Sarracenia purpurea var. burkii]